MAQTYKLAVIPGDGIGIEVTSEALKVLNAAVASDGVTFEQTEYDRGPCVCANRRGIAGLSAR